MGYFGWNRCSNPVSCQASRIQPHSLIPRGNNPFGNSMISACLVMAKKAKRALIPISVLNHKDEGRERSAVPFRSVHRPVPRLNMPIKQSKQSKASPKVALFNPGTFRTVARLGTSTLARSVYWGQNISQNFGTVREFGCLTHQFLHEGSFSSVHRALQELLVRYVSLRTSILIETRLVMHMPPSDSSSSHNISSSHYKRQRNPFFLPKSKAQTCIYFKRPPTL